MSLGFGGSNEPDEFGPERRRIGDSGLDQSVGDVCGLDLVEDLGA